MKFFVALLALVAYASAAVVVPASVGLGYGGIGLGYSGLGYPPYAGYNGAIGLGYGGISRVVASPVLDTPYVAAPLAYGLGGIQYGGYGLGAGLLKKKK